MKHWLALLLALSLLRSNPLAAQSRAADSLRALLAAPARPDTVRVRRLQALADNLMMSDLPQATTVLEEALALSRRLADPKGEGGALISLGTACRLQARYPEARRYTRQAQALFRRRGDRSGLSKAYLQLSIIEMVQGNPPAALLAALRGLPYAERAADRITQTQLQAITGTIYVQAGSYEDAQPVLRAALENGKALGDQYVVASALSMLGYSYQMLKNWPQALAYYRQSVRLNRRLGDLKSVAIDETSLAELYAQRGDAAQALAHGFRARALVRANKDTYTLPLAELALAHAYQASQRPDSAIRLARHGFGLSQLTRSNESLRNASHILALAYAQRGDYAQAYRYQSLWVAYNDSISGERTRFKISALRYGYELGKKQDQIALLTKNRQLQAQKAARQRQQLYGLLAGLLGAVLLLALLGRNVHLKQRANRILNEKNDHIARQRDDLNRTLLELKGTQNQLVQSEKMVALAALTAGVAHEIQNPLNFVNNFSEVSMELVAELEEEERKPSRDVALEAGLLGDLKQNLRKIHQHGSRAGDIVKGMLEHARADTGQRQAVDLNAMVQDYLRLAYHGLRAKYEDIVVTRTHQLDPQVGLLQLVPQEIGRVLLNLFTNAFYAVQHKALLLGPAYLPAVRVTTRRLGSCVEVRVRDNGTGIAADVVEKIFDPFFTTKPPGEGTGLGLWLSYDIVTKGYGGKIAVKTEEGEYTEFVVTLPVAAPPPG